MSNNLANDQTDELIQIIIWINSFFVCHESITHKLSMEHIITYETIQAGRKEELSCHSGNGEYGIMIQYSRGD